MWFVIADGRSDTYKSNKKIDTLTGSSECFLQLESSGENENQKNLFQSSEWVKIDNSIG